MHFKEKPGCKSLDGVFQLDFITQQMKDEGAITEYNDYVKTDEFKTQWPTEQFQILKEVY
jgi:hypothetical protein